MLNTNFIRPLEIYFLFAITVIFYNNFNTANALVGSNIRQAEENEFPYVISIGLLQNVNNEPAEKTHRCTATLISNQDALTSLHCLTALEQVGFRFLIGSHDLRQADPYYCMWWWSFNYWAEQRNIHPEFRQNDVAFIKIMGCIANPMQFPNIPTRDNLQLYGKDVVTATWGVTNDGETSRMLQTATLTIISHSDCEQRIALLHGSRLRIHARRLCSIAHPFVLLQGGDSGGSLLYNGAVIALNHGTAPKLEIPYHPEQTNLHFALYYYRDFLLDVRRNTQTHIIYPG